MILYYFASSVDGSFGGRQYEMDQVILPQSYSPGKRNELGQLKFTDGAGLCTRVYIFKREFEYVICKVSMFSV